MDKLDPSYELEEPSGLKPENELPQPEGLDPEHELESGEEKSLSAHNLEETRSMREENGQSHHETSEERVEKIDKKHPKIVWAIIGMIGLLIILGVFFYFFSDKLFKQEQKMVPPTYISTTPTISLNDTSSWKSFISSEYNFTFKYPTTWANPQVSTTDYDNSRYHIKLASSKPFEDEIEVRVLQNPQKLGSLEFAKTEAFKGEDPKLGWNNSSRPMQKLNLPGLDATQMNTIIGGASGEMGPVVFIANGNSIIEIVAQNLLPSDKELFNQIVSTFQLTHIGSQVMCTQEVKQCPDGSYVGRTGPNCAFATCPGN